MLMCVCHEAEEEEEEEEVYLLGFTCLVPWLVLYSKRNDGPREQEEGGGGETYTRGKRASELLQSHMYRECIYIGRVDDVRVRKVSE